MINNKTFDVNIYTLNIWKQCVAHFVELDGKIQIWFLYELFWQYWD